MAWLLAPLALLIERAVGYPPQLFRLIGHPVTWMGALITWLEARLNAGPSRRWKGVIMLALLLVTGLAVSLLIVAITRRIPFGWGIEAILASSLLAQKELGRADLRGHHRLFRGVAGSGKSIMLALSVGHTLFKYREEGAGLA